MNELSWPSRFGSRFFRPSPPALSGVSFRMYSSYGGGRAGGAGFVGAGGGYGGAVAGPAGGFVGGARGPAGNGIACGVGPGEDCTACGVGCGGGAGGALSYVGAGQGKYCDAHEHAENPKSRTKCSPAKSEMKIW